MSSREVIPRSSSEPLLEREVVQDQPSLGLLLLLLGGQLPEPWEQHGEFHASLQLANLPKLLERELDVLRHVGRGRTNAEIAAELHLGETTVKTHVSHISQELNLRERITAVVLAHETGLVRPGGP